MDKKISRMKNLIQMLTKTSEEYYNSGNPIMSDSEYDNMFDELKELEEETGIIMSNSPTQNVGSKVLTELREVEHNHPMLSLNKCHSVEEVIKFSDDMPLVAMTKLDGMTISIMYKDGRLVSAETRGNGTSGSDVTEHVKNFLNVPLTIKSDRTHIIDGEAIITNNDFDEINNNGEYANSRNLTSGTLSVLDTSLVSNRRLRFVAWDLIEGFETDSFKEKLYYLSDLGFDVTPWLSITQCSEKIIGFTLDKIVRYSHKHDYPYDGVVFKFNDIEYGRSLGATGHHLKNAIAYKFKDRSVETTLKNIEWQVGKSGVITPVAVFEPVEIEGSIVERASLHNLNIMYGLWGGSWYNGLTLSVVKANQIIPKVIAVTPPRKSSKAKRLDYPKICPVCKSKTTIQYINYTKNLICTNPLCQGKFFGKIKHFVSKNAMNIEGLSVETLRKFIDEGFILYFIDIYELKNNFGEDIVNMEGFGKRSADKLFDAIEKSTDTTLDRFIYALSIPMVGKEASKVISKYFKGDFNDFFNNGLNNPQFDWTQLEGFGDKICNSINKYANENNGYNKEILYELAGYLNFKSDDKRKDDVLSGKTFVITGKLNSFDDRDTAKDMIESHGGKVAGSVSKNTDYLVNNDIESKSGKNKKAKELGIPIITEEKLIRMLDNV